jgi:hypothetical protein
MPQPRKDEKKEAYLSRCMESDEMNSEFPKDKQRYAVCLSYWNDRNKKKKGQDMGGGNTVLKGDQT